MSRVGVLLFIEPQLPSLVDQPPEGAEWLHEVKHDGYRTLLAISRGQAIAYTRNGFDWTDRYPGIIAAAARLRCKSALLDGEVIVQDKRGASDFEALQSGLKKRGAPLIFYAFDLLHLDGRDCHDEPLHERRRKLRKLIAPDPQSVLQFSEEFEGDGAALFKACAKHQLEGIVSKLATAPYRSGRSKTWLKTKCFSESEMILVGIDRDRKTRAPRALLAKLERGNLVYAGPAFFALQSADKEAFESKLEKLVVDQPIFSWLRNRQAKWLKPSLAVRVKHLAGARLLRHATVRAVA
jgi:DNA ligase D-like protein (predicted ligase)